MAYTESEVRIEALIEMNSAPNGRLTTTQLIDRLEQRLNPVGIDAKILDGRSDTHFSQKVRNLVSHRNQSTGLYCKGFAVYDSDTESWTITDLGRKEALRHS